MTTIDATIDHGIADAHADRGERLAAKMTIVHRLRAATANDLCEHFSAPFQARRQGEEIRHVGRDR